MKSTRRFDRDELKNNSPCVHMSQNRTKNVTALSLDGRLSPEETPPGPALFQTGACGTGQETVYPQHQTRAQIKGAEGRKHQQF